MVKTACSDKLKGLWEEDENAKMVTRTGNWTTFSKRSGQRRSGKSRREKWISNQKEDSRQKSFTPQEEELVIQLHAAIGSRWPIIAQQLPGKTDNDVKILWNSKLRKKLSAMGIDPVTHKPFSQILADYGNIGTFPKARTRFSSLSRDLKNAITLKSEEQPQTFPNSDHHFSSDVKTEPFDLYSQIQAINLVTESTNYTKLENTTPYFNNERASSSYSPASAVNQDISNFSWSDFLLEDAFSPPEIDGEEDKGIVLECDGKIEGIESYGAVDDKNRIEVSSSSFVETMLDRQDEMFPQIPGSYEEIFYY